MWWRGIYKGLCRWSAYVVVEFGMFLCIFLELWFLWFLFLGYCYLRIRKWFVDKCRVGFWVYVWLEYVFFFWVDCFFVNEFVVWGLWFVVFFFCVNGFLEFFEIYSFLFLVVWKLWVWCNIVWGWYFFVGYF